MAIFRSQLKDSESSIDEHYFRSSSETYQVEASIDMDANQVRVGFGVTIYGTHPTDAGQVCKGVSAKLAHPHQAIFFNDLNLADAHNGSACFVWHVTVSFGPWDPLAGTATGSPSDQPPSVRFEGVTYQEVADLDVDGNPVVNTAGDAFDPPVMRDRTRPVIKIVRNETSFDDSTILAYSDKVNSDTFYNYPPKTLKCSAPRGEPLYSQFSGQNYYRVEYELHYNADTWAARVLNQGYRQLVTSGGATTQEPILAGGTPISSPAMLDEDGAYIPPPVDASDIILLEYDIYEELDFTATFDLPPGLLN